MVLTCFILLTDKKMEDIQKLKNEFDKIVKKYKLNNTEKSNQIAQYLTNNTNKKTITNKEFAKKFDMNQKDAITFLKFIKKGIEFKEKNIDKK